MSFHMSNRHLLFPCRLLCMLQVCMYREKSTFVRMNVPFDLKAELFIILEALDVKSILSTATQKHLSSPANK